MADNDNNMPILTNCQSFLNKNSNKVSWISFFLVSPGPIDRNLWNPWKTTFFVCEGRFYLFPPFLGLQYPLLIDYGPFLLWNGLDIIIVHLNWSSHRTLLRAAANLAQIVSFAPLHLVVLFMAGFIFKVVDHLAVSGAFVAHKPLNSSEKYLYGLTYQ